MGMTDRQFDSYIRGLLRDLRRIEEEMIAAGGKNKTLEILIKDLEDQLKRP